MKKLDMKKKCLILGIVFFAVYILLTVSLLFIDRAPIGPNSSIVGFSSINNWFHNLTGVHLDLYNLTDYAEIPAILIGVAFAILGFIQLIKRKGLFKVDYELLILCCFYVTVFLIFVLFDFIVINRRPVLLDGVHEPSFPSSTTFLAITFTMSAPILVKKYFKNNTLKNIINIVLIVYMLFLVIGRTISGVHWLTDILGGIFISISLLCLYFYFILLFKPNEENINQ